VGASVIPVLAGVWALVGVLALVWLMWSGRLRLTRRRQPVKSQSSARAVGDLDAEWIYGDRAERKPRVTPQELIEEARLEAEAIVRDAELKAREIVATTERARGQVEAELARKQAHMAEKSKKLSEFLANALEEVERASVNGRASPHDLDELEALRDELRSTE
jgi:vacuolar-type H+-ATPase subunit H